MATNRYLLTFYLLLFLGLIASAMITFASLYNKQKLIDNSIKHIYHSIDRIDGQARELKDFVYGPD